MRAWAVIPAFNEREGIARAVHDAPWDLCQGVVVVDGGSDDGTPDVARAAGAEVVAERRSGYGLAMTRGIERARAQGADAFVCFDGNGAARPRDVRGVLEAVTERGAEVAIGSRDLSTLRPAQRVGNGLAIWAIERKYGVRFADVGAIRAFTDDALRKLALREMSYGWPLELMVRSAKLGLHTEDLAVEMRPRRGRSKVSGTLAGTAGATRCFLRILATELAR